MEEDARLARNPSNVVSGRTSPNLGPGLGLSVALCALAVSKPPIQPRLFSACAGYCCFIANGVTEVWPPGRAWSCSAIRACEEWPARRLTGATNGSQTPQHFGHYTARSLSTSHVLGPEKERPGFEPGRRCRAEGVRMRQIFLELGERAIPSFRSWPRPEDSHQPSALRWSCSRCRHSPRDLQR